MSLDTLILQRKRSKSFLDTSLRLNGITHLLELTKESLSFRMLYEKSKIKYKKSFLKYLQYCVEKKLIIRTVVIPEQPKLGTVYVISIKGRMLLEMLHA